MLTRMCLSPSNTSRLMQNKETVRWGTSAQHRRTCGGVEMRRRRSRSNDCGWPKQRIVMALASGSLWTMRWVMSTGHSAVELQRQTGVTNGECSTTITERPELHFHIRRRQRPTPEPRVCGPHKRGPGKQNTCMEKRRTHAACQPRIPCGADKPSKQHASKCDRAGERSRRQRREGRGRGDADPAGRRLDSHVFNEVPWITARYDAQLA